MEQITHSLKIVMAFLLLFSSNRVIAQNKKIDSLTALLGSGSERQNIEVQFELARQYMDVDNALGFALASKAFQSAKRTGDSLLIVKTGRAKAQGFRRLAVIDSAMILFQELLPVAKRNNLIGEIKHISNAMSVAYLMNKEYDKALHHFFELLQEEEIANDKFWKATVLNNIGVVYQDLDDFDNAILYYNQALPLKFDVDDQIGINIVLVNMSMCLTGKGAFHEARNVIDQVFSRCNNGCSDDISKSLFNNLGVIEFLEGKYSEAENEFKKAYRLSTETKDQQMVLEVLHNLVTLSARTNDITKAEYYFQEFDSLVTAGVPYSRQILQAYSEYAMLHTTLNNFKTAATYQHKYILLSDSVFNEELSSSLMRIEASHIQQENNVKLKAQAKILSLNEKVIQRQTLLSVATGVIALLLVGIVVLLIRTIRQKQRLNTILDNKVHQRTEELKLSRDGLQRAADERDLLIRKVTEEMRSSLATIKGLCHLGSKDMFEAQHYLDKVNIASDVLVNMVVKLEERKLINDVGKIEVVEKLI